MRKILTATIVLALLALAVPLDASLAGDWKGGGEGVCTGPISPPPDFPIYAWQNWEGKIPDTEDKFYGEWNDETGNYGNFKGSMTFSTPEEVACVGSWTWFDTSVDPPHEYVMGRFLMKFNKEELSCYGDWSTSYSDEGGKMWGGMVD